MSNHGDLDDEQRSSHLIGIPHDANPQPHDNIWIPQELKVLDELLDEYKSLERKDKRPFLQRKAIPAIKNVWGSRYKDIGPKDRERKKEWKVKKTVYLALPCNVDRDVSLTVAAAGCQMVPEP